MVSFTFPLDEITPEQAAAILAGRISSWTELGGPDTPAHLLGWSKTGVVPVDSLDQDHVAAGPAAEALLAAVARQPGSVSLLAWDGPRLRVKALALGGQMPSDAAYPLKMDLPAIGGGSNGGGDQAGSFTLSAVGDLMLGRRVNQRIAAADPSYELALAAPVLQRADVGFGNLEVSLTDQGQPVRKDYTFRAAPALASGLLSAGIQVVSLANNHVGDYGATGIADTVTALDLAGVAHSGAGTNAAAAGAPAMQVVHGTRIAFLSFVNVPVDTVTAFATSSEAAGSSRAGVAWGTADAVKEAVVAARATVDVVIVSIHAGTEYAAEPNEVQRTLAHAAIDAGAALVLGSHPHVLQGIEYYKGGVIFYSLGNFVFDLDPDDLRNLGPAPAETLVAQVTFRGGQVRGLELVPMMIDTTQYRPTPAAGTAARLVLDRVYRLTDELNPP